MKIYKVRIEIAVTIIEAGLHYIILILELKNSYVWFLCYIYPFCDIKSMCHFWSNKTDQLIYTKPMYSAINLDVNERVINNEILSSKKYSETLSK